ncbi:hypothetical protein X777_09050 [Ooceraea biroi]|uniref:Complex III subunit 9 n=1 Tax=Ooceraea biroi TaxID=2015173 RepID=A0A026WAH1_OOCBI|nr:hypothetical protein X777_09050 [Ooceraea biroi]
MAFGTTLYNLVLKRTSTFMVVVVGATFFFERGVDVAAEKFWDSHNARCNHDLDFGSTLQQQLKLQTALDVTYWSTH